MKNWKFEKINMKLVIAIALVVIFLLTAAFIIFKTNLIIEHKDKDEKNPVVDNGEPNDPNDPSNPDNPDDPSNPDNPGSGDDPSKPTDPNKPNNPGNQDDPSIYDDPEEDGIAKNVKNRTKKAKDLVAEEKEYIIKENVEKKIAKTKELQEKCTDNKKCRVDVKDYLTYSSDKEIGKKIDGCKGKVIFRYDKDKKTTTFDLSELNCE